MYMSLFCMQFVIFHITASEPNYIIYILIFWSHSIALFEKQIEIEGIC